MKNQKRFVAILAGIMAAVMLLSLLLSLIPAKAKAASSSEIRAQINALKETKSELVARQEEIQTQYKENKDDILDLVEQKNLIDQEIVLLYNQIDNINQQLSAFSLLIADKQDELDEAQSRLDAMKEKNKERIRAMEEDGTISYWSVLFKANSFADLLDRLSMVEEIAAADQRRLKAMAEVAQQVAEAREELEAEKQDLESTKSELDEAQLALDEKRAQADELLLELIARSDELQELYAQIEQEKEDLLAEIAQKEKEYQNAKNQEWLQASIQASIEASIQYSIAVSEAQQREENNPTTPGQSGSTTPTQGSSSAYWLVPCDYRVLTSPFGPRTSPTAGASSNHMGVDLAGPEGTPIHASRSGVVSTAASSNSFGNYVVINHGDGFSSQYAHMTHYVVSVGQRVSAGDVIGYMGSTGISTGNHLHFGIILNGSYVNPANYVALHA